MSEALPETILQFGAGRFMRGFADLFVSQANAAGQKIGRIVVVQSTGDDRAARLNAQGGRYHVLIRGLENGQIVERVEVVDSISRALVAATQWHEVLNLARSPKLQFVLSNTTESGYALDPLDRPDDPVPRSFPAKLLAVLRARYEAKCKPLIVIPCELREGNAGTLRKLVVGLGRQWELPKPLLLNLEYETSYLETLVDRIVVNPPVDHPLAQQDGLLCVAEPYALWAIEAQMDTDKLLRDHPAVTHSRKVLPFFLRKVRILNGAHTALLIKAWPRGFRIVREAVNDPEIASWLEALLFEEIVPTVADRVVEAEAFARQTLERFRNPFQEHKLADIAAHHADKVQVRLVSTRDEFTAKFGHEPPLLAEVLAAPVLFD